MASLLMLAAFGIAATAEIASSITASQAAEAAEQAQEQAVHTQTLQQEYKEAKQQNIEAHQLHVQLAENEMVMANRGLSAASPSFNAIQRNTLVKGQEAMEEGTVGVEVAKLSEQSQIESLHREESMKQKQLMFGTIGNLTNLGVSGFNMFSSLNSPMGSISYRNPSNL